MSRIPAVPQRFRYFQSIGSINNVVIIKISAFPPRLASEVYLIFRIMFLLFFAISARAELKPETLKGFQNYIQSLEAKLEKQNQSTENFLWIDRDSSLRNRVRNGEIVTQQVTAPTVPDGLIQHWKGAVFLPGVTLDRVISVDQNYNRHKTLYSPDVVDSKILSHQGDHFRVFLRLKKHQVITVILDTVHEIDYIPLDEHRMYSRSRCDHVQEVKDAGEPDEHVLPVGDGVGFMWAINSYWRLAERDGGVYAECEAVTLSRDIPFGMGGVVGPVIRSLAADSLTSTLTAKRRILKSKK